MLACAEEETAVHGFQSDFNVSCAALKSTFKSILSPFLCPLTHREAWFMNPCSLQCVSQQKKQSHRSYRPGIALFK